MIHASSQVIINSQTSCNRCKDIAANLLVKNGIYVEDTDNENTNRLSLVLKDC